MSKVVLMAVVLLIATTAAAQNVAVWQPGAVYAAGTLVAFDGVSYRCLYAHTAVVGWEPAKVPVLWSPASEKQIELRAEPRTPGRSGMFAPYVHMTESSSTLPEIQKASGTKHFTLAFIIANGGCSPAWQGDKLVPLAEETTFAAYIKRVRAAGGDVIISFGGYVGQELAQACADADTLRRAYQAVVDKYNVKSLDLDVEASAVADPPSIDKRSEALTALAAANPGLQISFTLPVGTGGLPDPALNVLKSAVEHRVPVAVVNIMAMDYGYPVPDRNMGPAAIVAAEATLAQMQSLGLRAGLGITPMIGMNDTPAETFTVADARTVLSYARSKPQVVRLSMWSAGRDNGSCATKVSPTCSGIAQKPWDFSRVWQTF